MAECTPVGVQIGETGFGYTMSLINGKYKMLILYWLAEHQVVRYNELKRSIENISHKTLSLSLKELARDDLICRVEYPQVPPKVEYSLSLRGQVVDPHPGCHVRMGRAESRGKVIELNTFEPSDVTATQFWQVKIPRYFHLPELLNGRFIGIMLDRIAEKI